MIRRGCSDAGRIHIVADSSQRTLETGRAFAESLMPGCGLAVHSQSGDQQGPAILRRRNARSGNLTERGSRSPRHGSPEAPHGTPLRDRYAAVHSCGGRSAARKLLEPPFQIGVSLSNKTVEMAGPFSAGSTLSEDLLLEYANGFKGAELGWGRLTREKLLEVLSRSTPSMPT